MDNHVLADNFWGSAIGLLLILVLEVTEIIHQVCYFTLTLRLVRHYCTAEILIFGSHGYPSKCLRFGFSML